MKNTDKIHLNLFIIIVVFILIVLSINYKLCAKTDNDNSLNKARELYFKAAKSEEYLEEAIEKFTELSKSKDINIKQLSEIYIGSLTTLKAKYTFFPHNKFSYANEGIEIMEKSISENQNNVEVLFIYGSTCYHLPFFFNKKEIAQTTLKKVILLLATEHNKVDKNMLKIMVNFINENIEITPQEKKNLANISDSIN